MPADLPLWRFRLASGVLLACAAAVTLGVTPAYASGPTSSTVAGPTLPPVATVTAPQTPSVSQPLRVASYNIRCSVCRVDNPEERPWSERRAAVVKTIEKARPDVIGLQEASSALLRNAKGKRLDYTQFEDLVDGLGDPYRAVSFARSNCVAPPRLGPCEYHYRGASRHTKIVYNADRLKLMASGTRELSRLPKVSGDRYLAWAIFRQRSTNTTFFFADTHLNAGTDTGKSTLYARQRRLEAREVTTALTEMNVKKLPTILVGDMNATRTAVEGRNPHTVFAKAGLIDTQADPNRGGAKRRIGLDYPTFPGFDRTPSKRRDLSTRAGLDYILTTPMRITEWENVVDLDSKGRVRGIIPSDHNLIRATVYLPRPAPKSAP